ncbi:MAG: hypothetical protein FD189_771 [Elusimicrobia bacterium]|nr:MAG: hypothetical protein FD154_702 [Elusimicrobiota bacterium]KAF0157017.1 MAG: hypothetical protein FD189_771 [Elusimicrobiota bacterium]
MTWEELSRKYDTDNTRRQEPRTAVKGRPWQEIMKSTDKLVWLFLVTGGNKSNTAKAG